VFGESRPLTACCLPHATRPATLIKALHPVTLFEAHHRQIAAHKPPPEDPSRQAVVRARLERTDMPRGNLGGLADRLHGQAPRLPRPAQLLTKCRYSTFVPHGPRTHPAVTAPSARLRLLTLREAGGLSKENPTFWCWKNLLRTGSHSAAALVNESSDQRQIADFQHLPLLH